MRCASRCLVCVCVCVKGACRCIKGESSFVSILRACMHRGCARYPECTCVSAVHRRGFSVGMGVKGEGHTHES
jgi:hypothetical protein